jgi:hypothetical protein
MKQSIVMLVALILGADGFKAEAGLGWNYAQCRQHYGEPRNLALNKYGLHEQAFDLPRYVVIAVFGNDGTAISIRYLTRDKDALNDSMVRQILYQNAQTWEPGEEDLFGMPGERQSNGSLKYQALRGMKRKSDEVAVLEASLKQEVDFPAAWIGGVYSPATYFWTLEIDSWKFLRMVEEIKKAAAKNL